MLGRRRRAQFFQLATDMRVALLNVGCYLKEPYWLSSSLHVLFLHDFFKVEALKCFYFSTILYIMTEILAGQERSYEQRELSN